jgi:NADH-quinone oxidoreductase subunit L
MVTHAFFKALLFLGSGSVIHGMHGEQDMRKMGGLLKFMPITAVTFMIGWLAIAGIPPFSGFWSKDEILLFAWADNKALWAIGLVTALLTAYYMSRQVFLVFFGEPRFEQEGEHAVHPHESPWTMWVPLVVLTGAAIVAGALNLPLADDLKFLEEWLHPVLEFVSPDGTLVPTEAHIDVSSAVKVALAFVAVGVGVLGILYAAQVFLRRKAKAIEPEVLAHGWYYDESITAFMGGPGRAGFDAVAEVDAQVVDGAVNGVGALVRTAGAKLRGVQTGYVRNYALGIAVGAVILVGLLLGWGV